MHMIQNLRLACWLVVLVPIARTYGQTCTDTVRNGQETDRDCGGPVCPKCLSGRICLNNSDCLSGTCTSGKCAEPVQCRNRVKDRRETDIDCGGGECFDACWVGKQCLSTWDCRSKICTNGICVEVSTCDNNIQDGRETDIDCGGGACSALCNKGQKCVEARDCSTGSCVSGRCGQPATCRNGLKDGSETDVDCGGLCDIRCSISDTCKVSGDCISNVCSSGTCVDASSCRNGVRDGSESDIDCGGGGCAARCTKGRRCSTASDCSTGTCTAGLCVQPTTCTNKVKDGTEGDIDCGGVCDRQCGTGNTCSVNSDCISNVCSSGRCADAPTCSNGLKDARETDVDCGGGGCSTACDVGQNCASTWDCKTRQCVSGVCTQLATCTNGIWNTATEGALDCGQLCNRQCGTGRTCRVAGDCISNTCTNGVCADAPTCSNSKKDSTETDVDCGGGGCSTACDVGQQCLSTWDCKTKLCSGGVCQQLPTCTNGVLDSTEGAIDCGQLCSRQCGTGKTCKINGDCISNNCDPDGVCMDASTCTNNRKDGAETDVDCGGGGCSKACAPGQRCASTWDCESRICNNGLCEEPPRPTCTDGIRNGKESDVDCGGPDCPPCLGQRLCWSNSDCASNECNL